MSNPWNFTTMTCTKHQVRLECLPGCSAHEDNWYCPECDKDPETAQDPVIQTAGKKASALLESTAQPFDSACMMVRDMEERLAMIYSLLESGFDPENAEYDLQAVNQTHRIAAGGELPRATASDQENEVF